MAEMDLNQFRGLLRTAMDGRKQQEFADAAGISKSRIAHMLNDREIGQPTRTTLIKIADASNGRVQASQLFEACGHDVSGAATSLSASESIEVTNYKEALKLKEGIEALTGAATRYECVEDMLDTACVIYSSFRVNTFADEMKDYTGKGRKGAEKYVDCRLWWVHEDYVCVMPFILFCCETTGGGVVISDSVFDLNSMLEMKNTDARNFLLATVEKGDVDCSDFDLVLQVRKRSKSKEQNLLAAIFGEAVAKSEKTE